MSEKKLQNSLAMSKDDFWNLVEETRSSCGDDQKKYLHCLKERLKELGVDYAQDFHDIVRAYEDLANTTDLWCAYQLMTGYCSFDGFIDFRAWLISRGRETYFKALRDPDSLADLDPENGTEFEEFSYAGSYARDEIDGENVYDCTDDDAWDKLVEELKRDIEYCEEVDNRFEGDRIEREQIRDCFPRLYDRFVNNGPEV